jgi:nucleoside-triphosphatase THEP1
VKPDQESSQGGADLSENPPAADSPRLAILTGDIEVGKTTVALRVAELARESGYSLGGFVSPAALGPAGVKQGIDLLNLANGQTRRLALCGAGFAGPATESYSFDPEVFDWGIEVVKQALAEGPDLLLVDEIGRIEFERGQGFAPLLPILAAGMSKRVLAVARGEYFHLLQPTSPLVRVKVFRLSAEDGLRLCLPHEIMAWLFA